MFRFVQFFLMTLTLSFLLLGKFGVYQCLLTGNYCLSQDCCEEVEGKTLAEVDCCASDGDDFSTNLTDDTTPCCSLVSNFITLAEVLKKPNLVVENYLWEIENINQHVWEKSPNSQINLSINFGFPSPPSLPFYQLYCSYLC